MRVIWFNGNRIHDRIHVRRQELEQHVRHVQLGQHVRLEQHEQLEHVRLEYVQQLDEQTMSCGFGMKWQRS